MPCKCDKWVHRSCLNRKRISDSKYFDHCPVCGTDYNLEVKEISKIKVITEIGFSIFVDLFVFVSLFLLISKLIGILLVKFGSNESTTNPTYRGALILFGIVGFIGIIMGIIALVRSNAVFFDFPFISANDDNALLVFVIIGIVIVAIATFYWAYITAQKRYQRHKRAVDVKKYVVTDYLRGINNV